MSVLKVYDGSQFIPVGGNAAGDNVYYILSSGNSLFPNSFRIGINTTTPNLFWMNSAAMIPQVITIADSAVLVTNANSGNHFRVTLAANRTLGNPVSPIDGQKIVWELIQDATGGRTISYATSFAFGTDIPSGFTMSTGANARNFLGAIYNSATAKLYVVSVARGY